MTRDDIIRMAKEAGLITGMHMSGVEIVGSCGGDGAPTLHITIHEMAHFAALIAAAEREACAKVCERIEDAAYELWQTKADPFDEGREHGAMACVAAIRARGTDGLL